MYSSTPSPVSRTISRHVSSVVCGLTDSLPADANTITVPTKIVPRPNVVIRICTAECNFAAPLSDPVNDHIRTNITAWGRVAKQTTVWDYTTNFRYLPTPFPDWYALGPNLK